MSNHTIKATFSQYSQQALEQLKKGAFLTVKSGDETNTMTIGWGAISYIWNKPIFMVAVRYSRHTYSLIEKSREFTVSMPLEKDLLKALAFCGSRSGRDVNKFEECGLSLADSRSLSTPVIGDCELHYECRVVYQQAMEPFALDPEIRSQMYGGNNDFHVLYYGEILESYRN